MPLALDYYRADAEPARIEEPPEPGTRLGATAGLDGLGDVAAAARLRPQHHIVVVGRDSLSLALDLWRAGFVNVGCAPRSLDCVAHGAADALIVDRAPEGPDLGRIITRSRFMLRDGGWLLLHLPQGGGRALLPALKALLDAAGFVLGMGLCDADGRWITAQRRRPALRLV